MSEFTVIEESPITLVELKDNLTKLEKEGKLSFRGDKTKAYLDSFIEYKQKEIKEIGQKIEALEIPRLKSRHVTKVLDVMPTDLDSLRLLFSNETITIKEEDLKKILDVIPQ